MITISGHAIASGTNLDATAPADFDRELDAARTRYRAATNSDEAVWKFARASFDFADAATNNAIRARIAEEGIAACRQFLAHQAGSAGVHYYLGLDLGTLARTRALGALKLIGQMESEWSAARELDAQFDYAGPDRTLGLLYLQAPPIVSVGNQFKARQHLRHAVELAPGYPENRLNLVEAYLKWGEITNARTEFDALEKQLPDSQQKFAGPRWDAIWTDWNHRIESARAKIERAAKAVKSPHHADSASR